MVKDPVCGMDVDERLAGDQSEYRGKIYFFCSPPCREQFDQDQARFLEGHGAEQGQGAEPRSRRKKAA